MQYLELFYLLFVLIITMLFPGVFILKLYPNAEIKKYLFPLIPIISIGFNGISYWILYLLGIYYETIIIISWGIYGILFFLFFRNKSQITKNNFRTDSSIEPHTNNVIIYIFIVILFIDALIIYNYKIFKPVYYLSDMNPFTVSNIHGGLTTRYTYWNLPIDLDGKFYPKSISTHAPNEGIGHVQYKTFGYDLFYSKIGLTGTKEGKVQFSVGLDGKELLNTRAIVTGSMPPKEINVNIKGGKVIDLFIDPLGDNASDQAAWVNAHFIREAVPFWFIFLIGLQLLFIYIFIFSSKLRMSTYNYMVHYSKYLGSNLDIIPLFFVILFFVYHGLLCITTPFTEWDPVSIWNKWAKDMSSSSFVGDGYFYGYPQLMPSIFSVIYKMNIFNNDLFLNISEYVNHLFSFCFTIISCWVLYFYSRLRKMNPLIPILILLSNNTYLYWMHRGDSDILPGMFILGFFYLVDVYASNVEYFKCKKARYSTFVILSLFASAAASSKLPALLFLLFFALWFFGILVKHRAFRWKLIILVSIFPLLTSTFFIREFIKSKDLLARDIAYLHSMNNWNNYQNAYRIYEGDPSKQLINLDILLKIKLRFHEYISDFSDSPIRSKNDLFLNILKIIVILSLLFGIIKKNERFKVLFILPLFLIWVKYFGYELRHMLIIFPLLAWLISMFINEVCKLGFWRRFASLCVGFCLLYIFIINNIGNFEKGTWKEIEPRIFNMNEDGRFQSAFPLEANLISMMKRDGSYAPSNKAYGHTAGFKVHPACNFDYHPSDPPREMKAGDYFFTTIPSLDKQFEYLIYVGKILDREWYYAYTRKPEKN